MLDEVLLRLAVTLEKQIELKRKIKSAMAYPIAVGCIVVLIVSGDAHVRRADVRRRCTATSAARSRCPPGADHGVGCCSPRSGG